MADFWGKLPRKIQEPVFTVQHTYLRLFIQLLSLSFFKIQSVFLQKTISYITLLVGTGLKTSPKRLVYYTTYPDAEYYLPNIPQILVQSQGIDRIFLGRLGHQF